MARPRIANPRVQIGARVRSSIRNRIEDICEDTDQSVSNVVEQLLAQALGLEVEDELRLGDPPPPPKPKAPEPEDYVAHRVRVLVARGMTTPVARRQAQRELARMSNGTAAD